MDHGMCVRLFDGGAKGLIQHDDGYAVVCLGVAPMALGDDLVGYWRATGPQRIRNLTSRASMKVALTGNWGTPLGAIRANGGL